MSVFYCPKDAQMTRLRPSFPKGHGKPRMDKRRVLVGILIQNRNGLQWPNALNELGPTKTLGKRWKRRDNIGVFAKMMELFGVVVDCL
jgi:transposase